MGSRTAGHFFQGNKAGVSVDGETQAGFHTTITDNGASKSSRLMRDLDGGSDTLTSRLENGTISGSAIVTPGTNELYTVVHDNWEAVDPPDMTWIITVTKATPALSGTWTYTGVKVTNLTGPNLDADSDDPLLATFELSYALRVWAGS